ncbi:hypothetical protein DFH94DRAFT_685160 [Russula ochroleuca]|uniref:USP domain-containing protein n=1 Tax=Russula ochroleuca TaxID=152965 RepID=A0A9P5JY89_9AGAM|nr:hypothetical protein DFH94DRAFT_685160 [Russula ochroleuca]
MAPVAGKFAEQVHYKLYGVLYHHGESAGSGHYTVDVLHPNGDNGDGEDWLHIDDETVGAVRHGSGDNERMDDRIRENLSCQPRLVWEQIIRKSHYFTQVKYSQGSLRISQVHWMVSTHTCLPKIPEIVIGDDQLTEWHGRALPGKNNSWAYCVEGMQMRRIAGGVTEEYENQSRGTSLS